MEKYNAYCYLPWLCISPNPGLANHQLPHRTLQIYTFQVYVRKYLSRAQRRPEIAEVEIGITCSSSGSDLHRCRQTSSTHFSAESENRPMRIPFLSMYVSGWPIGTRFLDGSVFEAWCSTIWTQIPNWVSRTRDKDTLDLYAKGNACMACFVCDVDLCCFLCCFLCCIVALCILTFSF